MKKLKVILFTLVVLGLVLVSGLYFHHHPIAVLDPKGLIAEKERRLIIIAALLALVVVVPVFTITIVIALKYRESNKQAKYRPDWDHNRLMEFTWWAIPIVIISILAVITWNSSHELDPFKPIASSNPAIPIQVVALDWKWLFIYPEQNIASVNLVQFPVNTPLDFEITSDTVMNSFWIPSLGSQIYAMPGMSTQLHLIADQDGSYAGSSANISGQGFAGMTFIAKASSENAFNKWVQAAKKTADSLSPEAYSNLAKPSENNKVSYYSSSAQNLYDTILNKYMAPASSNGSSMGSMSNMSGMEM